MTTFDFSKIPGLNFIYVHRSQKRKKDHKIVSHFAVLGPVRSKAARRTLMKLTTGLNFISILSTAFTGVDPKSVNDTDNLTEFLRFGELRA